MPQPVPHHQHSSHLRAISLAIAGFTCFVLCDSIIKLVGASSLPNYQIAAWLGMFTALFIAAYTAWRTTWKDLAAARPGRLVLRSMLDFGNNLFVVVALRHLSLTLFYVLVFLSPLVISILGRFLLKEKLGWRRLCAILTGFLGVLVAVYPLRSSGASTWIGVAACCICVVCFSTGIVWSRVIAQTERPETIAFFSGLVTAAAGLAGMLIHAAAVSPLLLLAFVIMGLLGAAGSVCLFTALRDTTATTVSQYHYTQLVSGAIVSYVLFHEAPTVWLAAGAVLIAASGLYVALRAPRDRDSPI